MIKTAKPKPSVFAAPALHVLDDSCDMSMICNLKISETLQITRLDFCKPNPLLAWKVQRTTKLKQSTNSLLKIQDCGQISF